MNSAVAWSLVRDEKGRGLCVGLATHHAKKGLAAETSTQTSEGQVLGGQPGAEVAMPLVRNRRLCCPVHVAPESSRRQLDSEATFGLTETGEIKDADEDDPLSKLDGRTINFSERISCT